MQSREVIFVAKGIIFEKEVGRKTYAIKGFNFFDNVEGSYS